MKSEQEKIITIINSAIESVKPERVIPINVSLKNNILQICDSIYDLNKIDKVYVVGMGKASAEMARVLELILGDRISAGVVATKDNHSSNTKRIKILECSHPIPDEGSLTAGSEIISLCNQASENDLVIVLISGGGSVLAESLKENISISDLVELNKFLLNSGADINEINLIRQRFSLIKNGGLLNYIKPAEAVSLIISDIINNPIELIASAPTYHSHFEQEMIFNIVKKYNLGIMLSNKLIDLILEPPTENNIKKSCTNYIIADNEMMLQEAEKTASHFGYETILRNNINGNVDVVSKQIVTDLLNNKDKLIIYGGETTVKVSGNGKGGRNQELVLRILNELKSYESEFVFASVGSDGTDGPTDAAGAIVNNNDLIDHKNLIAEIPCYLENNDSYNFHNKNGSLIFTGPTKTNVMDLMIGYLK